MVKRLSLGFGSGCELDPLARLPILACHRHYVRVAWYWLELLNALYWGPTQNWEPKTLNCRNNDSYIHALLTWALKGNQRYMLSKYSNEAGNFVNLKCVLMEIFNWVHLNCTRALSFVFQYVQDKIKTQHILYMGCLDSVVWLLPVDNAHNRRKWACSEASCSPWRQMHPEILKVLFWAVNT